MNKEQKYFYDLLPGDMPNVDAIKISQYMANQSSLTPKSIRDSDAGLLEEIRQIKAVIIHFATLDKMPTLDLLNRERLIEHVVTRGKNILEKYPVKRQL